MRTRITSLAFAALALVTFASCAHGPRLAAVRDSIPALETGKGRIYFYRPSSWFGGAVQPDVKLNGQPVGSAKPGYVFFYDAQPGACKIEVTTEKTNETDFQLAAGETRYVRLEVSMGILIAHVSPVEVAASQAQGEIDDLTFDDPRGVVRMPASSAPAVPEKK